MGLDWHGAFITVSPYKAAFNPHWLLNYAASEIPGLLYHWHENAPCHCSHFPTWPHDWCPLPPVLGEQIPISNCKWVTEVTEHQKHKSLGAIKRQEETQWEETLVGRSRQRVLVIIDQIIYSFMLCSQWTGTELNLVNRDQELMYELTHYLSDLYKWSQYNLPD